LLLAIVGMRTCLFSKPLLNIFGYLAVAAQQQVYMPQYQFAPFSATMTILFITALKQEPGWLSWYSGWTAGVQFLQK
jgi:hypothetical protein